MSLSELNVLFTSVGRRVELVRSFRRAYARLELGGRIWATDIDPLAPALQEVDGADLVPRVEDPDYPAALGRVCERERIDLVLPLIDPDVPVLADNKEMIEASGARIVVIPRASVAIINDKWTTYEFFRAQDVPTPWTWPPEALPPGLGYPLFVKARQGSAGKGAFKVSLGGDLEVIMAMVQNPIVQEYVSGEEITSDVFCDLDGEVLAVVSRQRIEVRNGEVAKGRTIHNAAIQSYCVDIARKLDTIGPIAVQCLMSDRGPLFTEVNARFAGGAPLAIAAGADMPCWLLAQAAGMEPDIPPLGTYRSDLYMSRFDDSFMLTPEDLRNAARRGI